MWRRRENRAAQACRGRSRGIAPAQGNREEPVKAAEALEPLAPGDRGPEHAERPKRPQQHRQAARGGSNLAAEGVDIQRGQPGESTTRTEVADVDQGSDSATPTASQSASCTKPCRSGGLARRL